MADADAGGPEIVVLEARPVDAPVNRLNPVRPGTLHDVVPLIGPSVVDPRSPVATEALLYLEAERVIARPTGAPLVYPDLVVMRERAQELAPCNRRSRHQPVRQLGPEERIGNLVVQRSAKRQVLRGQLVDVGPLVFRSVDGKVGPLAPRVADRRRSRSTAICR